MTNTLLLVTVQILSLLQPAEVKIQLQEPQTCTLQARSRSRDKAVQRVISTSDVLDIRAIHGYLNYRLESWDFIALDCGTPSRIRIIIPEEMDRVYQGSISFIARGNNTINIVLHTQSEDLLGSITMSEMGECAEPEALKAFAVVARSFLKSGPRHLSEDAEFCDTTHCQVFRGIEPNSVVQQAVKSTEGLTLTYDQKVFRPYFSKSCGGKTATYQEIWGKPSKDYPYYSVDCPYKTKSWTSSIPLQTFETIGGIRPDSITKQDGNIILSNRTSLVKLTPDDLRTRIGRLLGWRALPGNQFELRQSSDRVVFEGDGIGHRIGLCQLGACEMAKRGASFQQILQHYFPNTEIRLRQNFEAAD